jgi:DNA-binding IclR family transcriptional regulator
MTPPTPPAPRRASVIGVRQPPARKLPNLTAARALRALEAVVFHAASAPGLAETMSIHVRTARRLLQTLEDEGYLQRGYGNYRQRTTYAPTARLLALAGQLATRLPLVTNGAEAVLQLRQSTGLDAYLVAPSCGDVIVLARAGDQAPALWSLLPATDSAGGSVLLAYRQSWRDAQRPSGECAPHADHEARAIEVRRRGYAAHTDGDITSLAVPVPMNPTPLAALVVSHDAQAVRDDEHESLLATLRTTAGSLRGPDDQHGSPPSNGDHPTNLPITATDQEDGRIRLPNSVKPMLPADRCETILRFRGTTLRARWNARHGPPEYSGTLYVGRHILDRLVDPNDVLTIALGNDGRIELS